MKRFVALTVLLAAVASPVVPAAAEMRPICLQSSQIDRTTVVNPRTILFRLKDGRVYRSDLRTPCLGLRFNGFVYVTPMDEICGGSQSIRVLNTDQVCTLGNFTPQVVSHHR